MVKECPELSEQMAREFLNELKSDISAEEARLAGSQIDDLKSLMAGQPRARISHERKQEITERLYVKYKLFQDEPKSVAIEPLRSGFVELPAEELTVDSSQLSEPTSQPSTDNCEPTTAPPEPEAPKGHVFDFGGIPIFMPD